MNNDYNDPELRENPPAKPLFDKLTRNILGSKPRVTRFKINWDDSNGTANGEMTIDNVPTEAPALFQNYPMNDQSMEHSELNEMNAAVADGINVDARINENSNSLVMEC